MRPTPLAHRLFLAIRPRAPVDVQIGNFADAEAHGAQRVRTDHLHATMAITDDFATAPIRLGEALIAVGAQVGAAPFDMALDRLAGSRRSVALRPSRRIEGLQALHVQIAQGMRRAGLALRAGWRFSPHVTLFYRYGAPFTRPISGFRWQVDELVLIHSLVGQAEHRVLGRWALDGHGDRQLALL